MVNLPAYFPSWTMSVTTWMFLGVAFWLRVPVLLHSLRSPVSNPALKRTLAEAESITPNRLFDRIKGSEYQSSAFDVTWILPMGRLPGSQCATEAKSCTNTERVERTARCLPWALGALSTDIGRYPGVVRFAARTPSQPLLPAERIADPSVLNAAEDSVL